MKSLYTHLNVDPNNTQFGANYIYQCFTGLKSPELKEHYDQTELLIKIKTFTYYIPLHPEFFKAGHIVIPNFQFCILKVCQEDNVPEEFTVSSLLSLSLMMGANFQIREYFLHHLKEVRSIYQNHVDLHLSLQVEPSIETQNLLKACNQFLDTVDNCLDINL
jgi:hypothetical protein